LPLPCDSKTSRRKRRHDVVPADPFPLAPSLNPPCSQEKRQSAVGPFQPIRMRTPSSGSASAADETLAESGAGRCRFPGGKPLLHPFGFANPSQWLHFIHLCHAGVKTYAAQKRACCASPHCSQTHHCSSHLLCSSHHLVPRNDQNSLTLCQTWSADWRNTNNGAG